MEHPDAWRLTDRLQHELGKGDPFAAAIRATRMPMIITDPRQDDNPIVFANNAFLKLTGYERDEIMGCDCRFLQGKDTNRQAIASMSDAIKEGRDIDIELLNYRKDGTSFWNALYVSPVYTDAGELQYFFASQLDITDQKNALAAKNALLHEIDHRVKNNLQMISALIFMQAKSIRDPEVHQSLMTMMERLQALSTVHQRFYQSNDLTRFSVNEFMNHIATELVGTSGRGNIDLRLELEAVTVSAEKAASIALIVNEVITNALKHAFTEHKGTLLKVAVKTAGERFVIEIEDDGRGMPSQPDSSRTSFGVSLIQMLSRHLHAVVTWTAADPSGTRVTIDLPSEQLKS